MKYFLITVAFTDPDTFSVYKVTVSCSTSEKFLSVSEMLNQVKLVSGKNVSRKEFSVSFLRELTKQEYEIWNS